MHLVQEPELGRHTGQGDLCEGSIRIRGLGEDEGPELSQVQSLAGTKEASDQVSIPTGSQPGFP